ncbi:MAG: DUF5706 domain-containing protein [Phaeodactylibacter sp.]|uniref:Pycsar system effector family protein n=1 Tax=Phaeodactylibacter sp. TaxID=1940289 RepID=UPI0032ED4DC6
MQEKEAPAALSQAVGQARQFVLRLYSQKQDARLLLHNYSLAAALAEAVADIGQVESAPAPVIESAVLAAWFMPTGWLFDTNSPVLYSPKVAQQFFQKSGTAPEVQQQALTAIQQVLRRELPTQTASRLLNDAYASVVYLSEAEDRLPSLRIEQEMLSGQNFTKTTWSREVLEQLLRIKWHTHHGQAHLQPLLAKAIYAQRAEVEKRNEKEEEQGGRFYSLEKKDPVRGAQTYFRTNYRNHINLSAIADNKANIMISVNAILVSVLITFLSYRNIGENSPQILLPVILFLVTGMSSLIFAVLSARPKVTRLNPQQTDPQTARQNLVFFGNFVQLNLEDYETAMDEIFQDGELLYGNMVRDLYFLGKVLDKKYRYLSISYTVFMVGFIATVLSFLVMLLV